MSRYLKGKKIIILFREKHFKLGYLRPLAQLDEKGGMIVLPMPAFYYQTKIIQEIFYPAIGKKLDQFGL
ncbi:MAG: hypothetical protein OS130_00665 [Thermodesulfobacteriota bacterium]|nr:MAG: hypothetical protein OS130_00665 [Thermodesulfobacteriota bacterium]